MNPVWLDGDRFWNRNRVRDGFEFVVVDGHGGDNYDSPANQSLAANLRGTLLLSYGTLDGNVHPNGTLGVIQELIRYNKDFDLMVFPNRNHSHARDTYFDPADVGLLRGAPPGGDTAAGVQLERAKRGVGKALRSGRRTADRNRMAEQTDSISGP